MVFFFYCPKKQIAIIRYLFLFMYFMVNFLLFFNVISVLLVMSRARQRIILYWSWSCLFGHGLVFEKTYSWSWIFLIWVNLSYELIQLIKIHAVHYYWYWSWSWLCGLVLVNITTVLVLHFPKTKSKTNFVHHNSLSMNKKFSKKSCICVRAREKGPYL